MLYNFVFQVLQYSSSDVARMKKEFELEWQARLLAKEREWLLKYDTYEEEKKQLNDENDKLKHSKEQMK